MVKIPELPSIGKALKKLRKAKHISLEKLSEASGVSKAMLSQVENGNVNPTVALMWKVTNSLGISLQDIVGNGDVNHSPKIIRQDQAPVLKDESQQWKIQIISTLEMAETLELYLLEIKKGGALKSKPHIHGTEEILTVLEGKGAIEVYDKKHELNEYDSIIYKADSDHTIINTSSAGRLKCHLTVRYK